MGEPTDSHGLDAIVALLAPGGRIVGQRALTGGVSTRVEALDLETADGAVRRLVLRRYDLGNIDIGPAVAQNEMALLAHVRRHGVPAAQPLAAFAPGEAFPEPALVTDYVEGETPDAPADLRAVLNAMASALNIIHAVPLTHEIAFLQPAGEVPAMIGATPDLAMREPEIRAALADVSLPPPANGVRLLHGDFWPGNILWRDGAISGVIDWEDALTGDPLCDLARTRLEVLWAYGQAAMDRLTMSYYAATRYDPSALAYWDLRALLRPCGRIATWGLARDRFVRMRRDHSAFLDDTLSRISVAGRLR